MTSKQLKALIKSYKSEIKTAKIERPLTDKEVDAISNSLENIPQKYRKSFDMALNGNFGDFENLPHLLRNYLGAVEVKKFRERFGKDPSIESNDVQEYLKENAFNAALRVGISAEKNAKATRDSAIKYDSYMNRAVMQKTMMPPTKTESQALENALGGEGANAAIEQNLQRQLVLAKTLLLAQIGKYEVINEYGMTEELKDPIYETFVHGSRTNFILPLGDDSQQVIDAFKGKDNGEGAGIYSRTAATHSVIRRTIDENGVISSDSKEENTRNPSKVFINQYGMNLSVGGIGSKGPDGNVIVGDGKAGHAYMRFESGDKKHCGSLLLGIEGSEAGKSDYFGHQHDMRARKAKQSIFVADKSMIGKKIGGRRVDLSGVSSSDLAELLNEFSEKYGELQRNAKTPEGREKLARVNDMLMGSPMKKEKISEMLESIGMSEKNRSSVISSARDGYIRNVKIEQTTAEKLQHSIRANLSQKEACSLAEKRFAFAGDDLNLSVGAVIELIHTHETRSRLWRVFHPIKNYRENSKISELYKRLSTEKGFSSLDIANVFACCNNSFSLKWGKELSNDPTTVNFIEQHRMKTALENRAFAQEKNTLSVLPKKIAENLYKISHKEMNEVMTKEVSDMQNEINSYKYGVNDEENLLDRNESNEAERESICVEEVCEIPANDVFLKVKNDAPQKEVSREL